MHQKVLEKVLRPQPDTNVSPAANRLMRKVAINKFKIEYKIKIFKSGSIILSLIISSLIISFCNYFLLEYLFAASII